MAQSRPSTAAGIEIKVDKLRKACLRRGPAGIKSLGRTFRIYDDDRSRSLSFDEFRNGIHDYGIGDLTETEIKDVFNCFDVDGSGTINFDEFLAGLRPPMSKARVKLVEEAFCKLDKTRDGVITIADLMGVYIVDHHPKYKSGEMTKKQVLEQFLKSFDSPANPDAKVTGEEFLNYYAGVSASIDKDVYFDYMMRQNWKL